MKHADKVASEAGHRLAMQRWGHTRVERLVSELSARVDQLDQPLLERLLAVVDEAAEAPQEEKV